MTSEQQVVDGLGRLMDNGFDFAKKSTMCTETIDRCTATVGTWKDSRCTVGVTQEHGCDTPWQERHSRQNQNQNGFVH